jgi:2-methylcitrate dehydratase PrpD
LQQAFRMDSMSKPLHAGHAAEAGVTAALAAREGVTGSLDVMEGEAGYGRAMGENPDWEKALATLGRDFHITRMTVKNHACCGHTFAAIDGALALKNRMQLHPSEIEKLEVATYRAGLEVAHYENPATPAEARFSLKYVVASALAHGSVRLAAFEPQRLHDPATRSLMQKIDVRLEPQLDAAIPAQRAARVAILARGRREEHLQPTRIGDPDAPLSDAQLEEKYLELAVPVLGEGRARDKLRQLWSLEAA